MVALPTRRAPAPEPSQRSADGPVAALFLAWRRLLTAGIRGACRGGRALAASRPVRGAALAIRYLRDPAGTLRASDADDRTLLKSAGAVALTAGVVLSFAVPGALGTPLVRRFLAAGWMAAWALARLFIMRTAARGALARTPSSIDDAWGPALLPFAVAVIDPLPLLALAASALLTLRGFEGLGVEAREARRVVFIAFGGQVAAEIVAWLARGGLVFLLSLRG
ncbi:MAG: hypothetical protein Q7W16_03845 [Coriobacteriia bacterium]|nr:hypothetical protein [Coriobacteriia bacterium]